MEFGPGDVRFFDRIAPLYDAAMPPARREPLARALAFARRPLETVLDVGGGTGRAARGVEAALESEPATATAAATDIVVVDRSRPMLDVARRRGFDCVQADATTLPVRTDAVDAVTVVDALHHVGDQRALVAEAGRALAPGGVLVVGEFDPTTVRGRLLALAEDAVGFDSAFTAAGDMVRFLEREGFRTRLVDSGFGYVVVGRLDE